jgi:hypothetical protein
MGWNGANTYGVRVDNARVAEAFTTVVGSPPSYASRCWVNFNGVGGVGYRGTANISSISRNGVGDYTVNFVTAMPDANYAIVGTATRSSYNAGNNPGGFGLRTAPSASSFRICTSNGSGTNEDSVQIDISVFR